MRDGRRMNQLFSIEDFSIISLIYIQITQCPKPHFKKGAKVLFLCQVREACKFGWVKEFFIMRIYIYVSIYIGKLSPELARNFNFGEDGSLGGVTTLPCSRC